MEPSAQNDAPKADAARSLQRAKQDLEAQIERAVADHARSNGGEPLEVSLNFEEVDLPEGEDNEANDALMDQIAQLVENFHDSPSVTGKGVHVRRLTAIDSDADGEVAVRVDYDYEGYE